MKKNINYYEVLGLDKNATKEQIESKKETYFEDFAKENNMTVDRAISFYEEGFESGEIAFDLDEIFDTLLDDEKRKAYDSKLNFKEYVSTYSKNTKKSSKKTGTIILTCVCVVTVGSALVNYTLNRADFNAKKPDNSYSTCNYVGMKENIAKRNISNDEMVFLQVPNYTQGIDDGKFIKNLTECLNNKKKVGLMLDFGIKANFEAEAARIAAILDDCLPATAASNARRDCVVFANRSGLTEKHGKEFIKLCKETFNSYGLALGFVLDPSSYYYNKEFAKKNNIPLAIKTDDKVNEPIIVRNNTYWDHIKDESLAMNLEPEQVVYMKK